MGTKRCSGEFADKGGDGNGVLSILPRDRGGLSTPCLLMEEEQTARMKLVALDISDPNLRVSVFQFELENPCSGDFSVSR